MAPHMGDGIKGNLHYSLYHSCPSGTIKIQRVYVLLSLSRSPGKDMIVGVIQHSSEVLTSLTSPLFDNIDPTSLILWSPHLLLQTLTFAY